MVDRGGNNGGRSGANILHEATQQTAQAINTALGDAARVGAERITAVAQEAIENLDLRDAARRTKQYVRTHPAQVLGVCILLALSVGLIVYGTRRMEA